MSRAASCLLSDLPAMCGAGQNTGEKHQCCPEKGSSSNCWSRGSGEAEEKREAALHPGSAGNECQGKKAAGGQFCELLVVRYLVTF